MVRPAVGSRSVPRGQGWPRNRGKSNIPCSSPVLCRCNRCNRCEAYNQALSRATVYDSYRCIPLQNVLLESGSKQMGPLDLFVFLVFTFPTCPPLVLFQPHTSSRSSTVLATVATVYNLYRCTCFPDNKAFCNGINGSNGYAISLNVCLRPPLPLLCVSYRIPSCSRRSGAYLANSFANFIIESAADL